MSEHAKMSPSGAHRWMRCPASLLLELTLPDTSSKYADEGTRAHELASAVLTGVTPSVPADDISMTEYIDDYAKLVREYAEGGTLLVEQRVEFSKWIDVPDSFGTSDAVIIHPDRLTVIDLKYGMGVKVEALENEQLMLYALGCLHEFGWAGDFTHVVMVIHMPRLNYVGEYVATVEELKAFAERAKAAAALALTPDAPYEPGTKQCRFCKAKATCPALRNEVMEALGAATASDFDDVSPLTPTGSSELASAMSKVELVEDWCKAIRAEVERRLTANDDVPGYKLVEGRLGARKWRDAGAVEETFKAWRLRKDEMYDLSLISPTKAQKLLESNPGKWAKLQEQIDRSPGKPSVAPATDRRPAISVTATAEDFG